MVSPNVKHPTDATTVMRPMDLIFPPSVHRPILI